MKIGKSRLTVFPSASVYLYCFAVVAGVAASAAFSERIHATISESWSSFRSGCGVMATFPQLPDPPWRMLRASFSDASLCVAYFFAMSLYAGPTTFRSAAADRKVVGPAYRDIAKKYATQSDASEKLARSIRQGGSGNWGNVAMTPHPDLKDDQLSEIVAWILSLKAADAATPATTAKQYKYTLADGKTVSLDFPIFIEGDNKKVTKDVFHGYQLYNSYCYRCH